MLPFFLFSYFIFSTVTIGSTQHCNASLASNVWIPEGFQCNNEMIWFIYGKKFDKLPTDEELAELKEECLERKKCFASVSCNPLYSRKIFEVGNMCDNVEGYVTRLIPCMQSFYLEAQLQRNNCAGRYAFLAKDTTQKIEAFTLGKSCFLKNVKKLCAPVTYDFLTQRYDRFLDILNIPSNNTGKCDDFKQEVFRTQCGLLQYSITEHGKTYLSQSGKHGTYFQAMCQEYKECLFYSCNKIPPSKHFIAYDCRKIELRATPLGVCYENNPSYFTKCVTTSFWNTTAEGRLENCEKDRKCLKTELKSVCPGSTDAEYSEFVMVEERGQNCDGTFFQS